MKMLWKRMPPDHGDCWLALAMVAVACGGTETITVTEDSGGHVGIVTEVGDRGTVVVTETEVVTEEVVVDVRGRDRGSRSGRDRGPRL